MIPIHSTSIRTKPLARNREFTAGQIDWRTCDSNSGNGNRFFSRSKRPDRFWGPCRLVCNSYRDSLPRVKRPEREVHYSPSTYLIQNFVYISCPLNFPTTLYPFLSRHMLSYQAISYPIMLYPFLPRYILSYHAMSFPTTLYPFLPRHILSYHAISFPTTPYPFLPRYILSYHALSFHLIIPKMI
jgi:hypothetical protein